MPEKKPHLNLAVIGHVDHGKSTLVGRLLYDTDSIDKHIVEKYRKDAESIGKGSFEFAWVMDTLKEERERGLTIDVSHQKFETNKYYFTVVDCPGHRDFVKNMITGASQADAGILVVDAKDGVQAQTKEHIFLSRTIGINQVIVAINKMDRVNYEEKRFNEVKKDISSLLKMIGYKVDKIPFIPISAFYGENIIKKSEKMPWYNGPTMIDAMNALEVPVLPVDLPLRLPIQDVYSISGVGTVPVGRVETGVMRKEDKIIFQPSNVVGEVKSIEMHHEEIPEALPGDNVGFNVRGISRKDIRRGDVCGHPDNPPTVAEEFTAQIVILQHPTAITVGYTPVIHCHTAQVACTFLELQKKLDPRTGQVAEENPDFLKTGDAAIVKLKPTRPFVIEKSKDIPQMGRFAVRDMGMTIAAGVCLDVKKII
ncbi:MAG: translation elongation factor EF-1 subunit alpha [Candidatus Methanoliparum thermophilum]|uniref:Elongation factor 1-alpha n=1 Tax=Methanoliparum thermophilum TaxID=2491083 RepID=A0A520KSJ6_METT2|nr:translation elongation factor EF-1 subunit alpha [Candidatus Methanoliparum sp. LAM-1]RZN64882.1 MAG: translation elongation factor EF-1 subunit alpha [Candidatus Methanoliparum thermophilum]BDC36245.1 elongation factor 1-alpha [Candidatus Methanoliparum sp. LAM-1]